MLHTLYSCNIAALRALSALECLLTTHVLCHSSHAVYDLPEVDNNSFTERKKECDKLGERRKF